jgi:5'(3')-deoxyribonucleotidase
MVKAAARLRLGIDLDGVVAQFNKGWMDRHRQQFGSDLDPAMVTEWNGLHRLGGFADMRAFWRWFRNGDEPSFFRHLEPYPDALDTLHRLSGQGHHIVILTSKFNWALSDTYGWLSDVGMPTREVHIREDKHAVACDLYLDDSPLVLPKLVKNRPEALTCRFVRAWNTPVAGAVDVTNWAEFEAVVAIEVRSRT